MAEQDVNGFLKRVSQAGFDPSPGFVLTKSEWENRFAATRGSVKNILQFGLMLPGLIPFQDGRTIIVPHDDGTSLVLIFGWVEDRMLYTGGMLPQFGVQQSKARSRCEVNVFYERPFEETLKSRHSKDNLSELQAVAQMIDRAVAVINAIIIAYSATETRFDIAPIDRWSLEFGIVYRIICLPDFSSRHGVVMNHVRSPSVQTIQQSTDQETAILRTVSRILQGNFPFYHSQTWYQKAREAFHVGRYADSIVFVNISLEVFIRRIVFMHWRKNAGISQDEAIAMFDNLPFMRIMKSTMPDILGGSWDIKKADSPVGKWYKDLYSLRNRVIHAGHQPSESEMLRAMTAFNEVSRFLVTQIEKSKKRHPWLYEIVYKAV